MRFLRTNTAIRITVGPFFDNTDGVTPETAITVTDEKLTFVVDDANVPTLVLDTAPTASGGNNDMVHITGDDAGFYDLELTAANVNYLGRAMISLTNAAVHCPVFHEFMILPANIYDSFVLGTDLLDVSTTQFNGSAVTASSGRPEVNTTHVAGTSQTAGDIIADTNDIQSRLPAALSGDGFIKADVKSIDDELTNGNNATLNLKKLNIVNSSGTALHAESQGGNGNGAYFQGHDFGYGLDILGGNLQSGLGIDNGTGAGNGAAAVVINGNENGSGIEIYSTNSQAIFIEGATKGIWIQGDGGDAVYLPSTSGKSVNAPNDIAVSDGNLTLAAIASAVWAAATRTLTAISDSSGITTLLSRITAALGIYTAADVRSAVGLASANLDTQLDALPTAAENATAVLSAAASNPIDANVQEVNDVTLTGDGSATPWGPA